GKPDRFGVCAPSRSRHSRTRSVLRQRSARIESPRSSLTARPESVVASDATGEGPEYRYGGAAVFSNRFSSGGQARNAASDEEDCGGPRNRAKHQEDFESPATSTTWS